MDSNQLQNFLTRRGLRPETLADILGVTTPAVDHWIAGRRKMPEVMARILRMFDRKPEIMAEFR